MKIFCENGKQCKERGLQNYRHLKMAIPIPAEYDDTDSDNAPNVCPHELHKAACEEHVAIDRGPS